MCIYLFLFSLKIVLVTAENKFEIEYSVFSEDNFDTQGWYIENPHRTYSFSQCADQKLFGGFQIFSTNTIVSYNSTLPPHYKIKISFTFYKIDSWNDEWVYIFLDEKLKQQQYSMTQDSQICGVLQREYEDKIETFEIEMNHSSQSVFVIIITNLDQDSTNESWGINNFIIEILKCPQGCIYCQDGISPCDYWQHFQSVNEWKKADNTILNPTIFAGLKIAGGYLKLGLNETITNTVYNLTAHFIVQVEFKLWFFGNWTNDYFIVKLDDFQLLNGHINQSANMIKYGGIYQNVSFINFRLSMNHSQPSIKIALSTTANTTQKKYWGINAFDLYLGKCSNNCEQCLGPAYNDCTVCVQDWVLFMKQCIYYDQIPPLIFDPISIVQKKYQVSNNIHPIQLASSQIAQESLKLGENSIEFDLKTQFINFEIQAQCPQHSSIYNSIQIYIRYNYQQEYILNSKCKENFPLIVIKINLYQRFEQIKQFILNQSETSVELHQLVIMDHQQTKLLILRVNLI